MGSNWDRRIDLETLKEDFSSTRRDRVGIVTLANPSRSLAHSHITGEMFKNIRGTYRQKSINLDKQL